MLSFESVSKAYDGPTGRTDVLRKIDLRLNPGDLAVIRGASGSGKSTLLFTAGAMLPPDEGRVTIDGESMYALPRRRRHALRAQAVGFVFQRFHLVPYLTVAENILWPLRWHPDPAACERRLPDLVRRLKLQTRLCHRPAQLSAGEQQRTAVARALIGNKRLICADEPTGNLDEDNASVILDMFKEEAERGCMVLLVTHHAAPAGYSTMDMRLEIGGLQQGGSPEGSIRST